METGYEGSKLKRKLLDYNAFSEAIQKEKLVFYLVLESQVL